MRRRALLATLGSATLLGATGCLTDDPESSPSPTRTGSPATQTPAETTTRPARTTSESPATDAPAGGAYVVPGADRILGPADAELRNESDEAVTLTLGVAYDGDRFFEESFSLAPGAERATDSLVASHATYDVVVVTSRGRRATYEWAIPENWHWPLLTVLVAADGTPRVGCAWPSEQSVAVANADGSARELTATLAADDGVVSRTTRTVESGTGTVALDVPIGGTYELRVETAAGSDAVPYVVCYCRTAHATVEIRDGVPTIDTVLPVCE